MKPGFVFALCFLIVHLLPAQQFGGTPASIKWKQINTDTVRIIFPNGFDAKAERIASVVHHLQKNFSSTIGTHIRKVNIVIQNMEYYFKIFKFKIQIWGFAFRARSDWFRITLKLL